MKIVQGPDGQQFAFPDSMSDQEIDMVMQREITGTGGVPAPAAGSEGMAQLLSAVASHFDNQRAKDMEAASMRQQQDTETRAADSQTRAQQTELQLNAAKGIIQSLTQLAMMVRNLQEPLSVIAQVAQNMPQAVLNLANTNVDVGKKVVEAINTPREIQDDKSGAPRVIGPVKNRNLH